jgi:hypothetical protein
VDVGIFLEDRDHVHVVFGGGVEAHPSRTDQANLRIDGVKGLVLGQMLLCYRSGSTVCVGGTMDVTWGVQAVTSKASPIRRLRMRETFLFIYSFHLLSCIWIITVP